MFNFQYQGNVYKAEIITDRTIVADLAEIKLEGEVLSSIVTVPAGYVAVVNCLILMSGYYSGVVFGGEDFTTVVRNNGGSISVGTSNSNGANVGLTGPPGLSAQVYAGSSGFGIKIDHEGTFSTDSVRVSAYITIVAHQPDLGT